MTHNFEVFKINGLKLAQSDKIGANKDAEFASLLLTFVTVTCVSLVLHADPQFVHFSKVKQDEVNSVFHCASVSLTETKFQNFTLTHCTVTAV